MRHKIKILLSMLMVAILTAGTLSTQATAATTLEFWTWNNEGDYVKIDEAAVARFEATHPGITVEVTYTPYGDYMTKLKAALAADRPPAIFQVPWDSGFRDLVQAESSHQCRVSYQTDFQPLARALRTSCP